VKTSFNKKNYNMYDSYGINIYYEIDPYAPLLRCGAFKWIRAGGSKINAMSENELREGIKIYLNSLENRYGHDYRQPRAWSPKIFKDKIPWFQMSTEALSLY
jgi:hypothetical protein